MHLLFVSRNFPPTAGGIETMVFQILKHSPVDNPVKVILCHFGQKRASNLPSCVARYFHFPSFGIMSTVFWTGLLVPMVCARYKPVFIVNSQVTTACGSYLSKLFFKTPYVIVNYGLELLPGSFAPLNYLKKILLKKSDLLLSISRYTDGLMENFEIDNRLRKRIGLGADPEFFFPQTASRENELLKSFVQDGDFVGFTVSRLVQRKGIDTILEALAKLKNAGNPMKYIIAGEGPDKTRLAKMTESLGLQKDVLFLGKVSDSELRNLFNLSDVFLLQSRESLSPPEVEGFGLVFLEAAACGTPSIGTISGGIPDAIEDGVTGFLVPVLSPDKLSEKILTLMENPELLNNMGRNALKVVREEKNWKKVSQLYWREFLKLADENKL